MDSKAQCEIHAGVLSAVDGSWPWKKPVIEKMMNDPFMLENMFTTDRRP
jgi:hypothetical protein